MSPSYFYSNNFEPLTPHFQRGKPYNTPRTDSFFIKYINI